MKITCVFLLAGALLVSGRAAPLAQTAAVQTKPDPAAPIVGYLKAGSEPALASAAEPLPPGWAAVQLPGPFDGFVMNADLTKGLEVKPGASIYLAPKSGAGVLAVAAQDDKAEITGLYGKWTKVRLDHPLVGYFQTGTPSPISAAPPPAPPSVAAPVPTLTPAPAAPPAAPSALPEAALAAPGQAAAVPNENGSAGLPRSFEGRFVSSRRLMAPRRPFPWQLNDESGHRYAYLDVTKLLLTDQIEQFIDHPVAVYGTLKAAPGGKDLVIEVESMRLQ